MCSLKLPDPLRDSGAEDAVFTAIADVAERSFFAMVDMCDPDRFAELAGPERDWLLARVGFRDDKYEGAVTVTLPLSLAGYLFDAFSGRDPGEPEPPADDVRDLVGEFANMICGAWLTKAANLHTFALSKPQVAGLDGAAAGLLGGVLVTINDFPCAIDVLFDTVSPLATAQA